jgi:acetone carboxylase gamma subunit
MGLHNQLFEFGSLSDKQTQIVREALARKLKWVADAEKNHAAALEADRNSTFVGELKERRDWVLVIKKVISFESQWGYVYINIMKDQDGNVIIGKGSKQYGTEGTTVKLKATIVKHDTREGIKQTFVNRPKFEV